MEQCSATTIWKAQSGQQRLRARSAAFIRGDGMQHLAGDVCVQMAVCLAVLVDSKDEMGNGMLLFSV